jgi:hypothetical protein
MIKFPLRLRSEVDDVSLADDIQLHRLDDSARRRLLGIGEMKFDELGKVVSFISYDDSFFGRFMGPSLDEFDELYSSNYVVSVPNPSRAKDVNFVLKLLGESCTSLFIGGTDVGSKHFLSAPCYAGETPLFIGADELDSARTFLALRAKATKDSKLALMIEMYLYAQSNAPRAESRFIELSVILEMLLLPTSSTELSYRFALRMAKLLHRTHREHAPKTFDAARIIYKTRSKLVHSGRDPNLAAVLPLASEATR